MGTTQVQMALNVSKEGVMRLRAGTATFTVSLTHLQKPSIKYNWLI